MCRKNKVRGLIFVLSCSSSLPGSSSHDALRLLQSSSSSLSWDQSIPTCSQTVAMAPAAAADADADAALTVSSGRWRYSGFTPPSLHLPPSTNRSALRLWLRSPSSPPFSFPTAPMLRLSKVAMDTLADIVKGEARWSPERPLKDWTAPPSLSTDHWLVGFKLPTINIQDE